MATRTGLGLGGDSAGYRVDADGGLVQRSRIAGPGLDSLIADGPLEPEEGLRTLRSAALAVDSVRWSGGESHGRLSPESIVIDDEGHSIFVIGFGARIQPVGGTESSPAADYMAPEVLEGAPVEASADTYALGCILFEVLTGEAPSRRDTRSATVAGQRSALPPSPQSRRPELPPGIDGVWVVNTRNGEIIEIDKRGFGAGHSQSAFSVGRPPTLLTTGPTSLTLSDDAAWVAIPAGSGNSTRLVRIDRSSKMVTVVTAGGRRPSQLALGGGSLWIGDREGTVRRLNPRTLEPIAEVNVGGFVAGMVWADDALWVSACDSAGG